MRFKDCNFAEMKIERHILLYLIAIVFVYVLGLNDGYSQSNSPTFIPDEQISESDSIVTKPLIVVDGEVKGIGSDVLNTINPHDIERIDVLKEKSATELYGEVGKNGVIIITTKKDK